MKKSFSISVIFLLFSAYYVFSQADSAVSLRNRVLIISGINYKLQTHQVEELPSKYYLTPCISAEWQYAFFPNHKLKLYTGAGLQYKKEHFDVLNYSYNKNYFLNFALPITVSLSGEKWTLEAGLDIKYLMYEKHLYMYPNISTQEMSTHDWFTPFNRFSTHTGMDLLIRGGYNFTIANKYQIGIFPEIRWYAIDNFYDFFHPSPTNVPQNKHFYLFSGIGLSINI